jgi:hypothetical protein
LTTHDYFNPRRVIRAVAKVGAKQHQQALTKKVNYELLEEILEGIRTKSITPSSISKQQKQKD